MKLDLGEYLITSDERQFIVSRRSIVQAGRMAKAENVGKEKIEPIAYCTSIDYALKIACKNVLMVNDDLTIIMDKLNAIEVKIKEFTRVLEGNRIKTFQELIKESV